ncbi:MAG: FecR family protein [Prolixibacteraceae bacterium]|jgi:ferric-dicitrate binding protein FerR (iron transport regulator)|nr:FecR family protein [Prolixibacteraceae bacterium]
MENFSKYQDFKVDDFVQDAGFRLWVMKPDNAGNLFWNEFRKQYPEKNKVIDIAYQIVDALSFEEREISRSEYQGSLLKLKEYLENKSVKKRNIGNFAYWMGRVAAVLIIPLFLVSAFLYFRQLPGQQDQTVQYIVPNGQKSNVILADGTSVWLNSGSILSYSSDGKNRRKVRLTGEAFFDVAKDKKDPFLVETRDYTVKVYGTQFNVRAYGDSGESETVLKEGSVSIITDRNDEVKLMPGQRFFLNENKKCSLNEVNPDLYLSWKDNLLRINNERLQDMVVRMERWYGVKIQVEKIEKVKDLRYTLTIKTESLREMLELMKFVTPLKYEINGENVILNYN